MPTTPTSIRSRSAALTPALRVTVVGTGYVGLTAGACLAELGHLVTCVDIDEPKIDRLRVGQVDILEAGLETLVSRGLAAGRLRFSADMGGSVADARVVLLCLPTPTGEAGDLDLRFVEAASRSMGPLLAPGAVVVTKSTVPVGTHRSVRAWLDRDDVSVVSNPEFLREGSAVADFFSPDRVVVGADDLAAGRLVASLYEALDAPVQLTDPATAELVKYAANAFLATKLSFVNEMSRLCDALGADMDALTEGLGADPRVGSSFLDPGPGWGGSCFPKDTRGLRFLAGRLDLDLPVLDATIESNERQFDHVVATVSELSSGETAGSRIGVWGLAFKAGTDDTRCSPAFEVVNRLVDAGAEVVVYDPAAGDTPDGVVRALDPYSACRDADLLVVLTEWSEFAEADLEKVAGLMSRALVYDTRAVVDANAADAAGVDLVRLGRPRRNSSTTQAASPVD